MGNYLMPIRKISNVVNVQGSVSSDDSEIKGNEEGLEMESNILESLSDHRAVVVTNDECEEVAPNEGEEDDEDMPKLYLHDELKIEKENTDLTKHDDDEVRSHKSMKEHKVSPAYKWNLFKDRKAGINRSILIFVVIVGIISAVSLLLNVLILKGQFSRKECACKSKQGPVHGSLLKRVQEIKANVTRLRTVMLEQNPSSLRHIWQSLNFTAEQLENLSNLRERWAEVELEVLRQKRMVVTMETKLNMLNETLRQKSSWIPTNATQGPPGPKGDRGPQGKQGAPGAQGIEGPQGHAGVLNFSLCEYVKERGKSVAAGSGADTDVIILEPAGKVIFGVTCSTNNAETYVYESWLTSSDVRVYKCHCKGLSDRFAGAQNTYCYIYYWRCPRVT